MTQWWVRRGDETIGPMLGSEIVACLRQGEIAPGDLACRTDGKDWLLVGAVPEVAEAFAVKRSAPPREPAVNEAAAWMIGDLEGEIVGGPVSLAKIKADLASGALTGGELLARAGSTAWQPIGDVMSEEAGTVKGRRPGSIAPPAPTAPVSAAAPTPVVAHPSAPQAPSPAAQEPWFYARGEASVGPVSAEQLRAMLGRGEILPSTYVCSASNQAWRMAGSDPQLATPQRPAIPPSPRPTLPPTPPHPSVAPPSDPGKRKPPPLPPRARKS